MNTTVSFKLAKLLKEKGFDEYCKLCVEDGDEKPFPFDSGNIMHRNSLHPYYSAPTIAEVIMWLYEKYKIWISVGFDTKKWFEVITLLDKDDIIIQNEYDSPTEAYEAGIEYCLTKLI